MTIRITKPEINLREKISELDKPSGVAGEAMLRAETPQEQQAMIGVGRRNMLINGDINHHHVGPFGSMKYDSEKEPSLLESITAQSYHDEIDHT